MRPIIEEERQQQPMTPNVMALKNFCRRLFRRSSLTKISIPVWMHKLYRLLLQLLPLVGTNLHNQTMPSAPSSPFAGPWAATREKLQSQIPCMDYNSCPGSGGISDASTLPMHPPPGMGFSLPSTPFAYACPAMETTSSSPQIGTQQGRIATDEVRKDRSPLPKLVIKGGDATTL